MNKHS